MGVEVMDIKAKAQNFLDDYIALCVKHGVVMMGCATEENLAEGLHFSSISGDGKIRVETKEFEASDVIDKLKAAFH